MKNLFNKGLFLAAAIAVTLPLASNAAVVNQDITVSANNAGSYSVSEISVLPGNTYGLNLMNFSPNDMTFSSPELGIEMVIPANSQKVVYLDNAAIANLRAGQTVSYYILDASGNRVATSTIVNEQVVITQTTTATETSTVTESKSAVQEAPAQAAPVEEDSSTVRGFW